MIGQEKVQELIDYYKKVLEDTKEDLEEAYKMSSTGEPNRTERYAKIRELRAVIFEIEHIIKNLEKLED